MRALLTTATALAVVGLMASAALAAEPSTQSPAKACKAELKADATLFAELYKAPLGSKKKPYPTCIQAKKQQAQALQDATKNAAKACKAERAANPEAFTTTYGTNKNGKNAFGKCVSSKAKEIRDDVESEVKDARVEACKSLKKNQPADFKATYKNLGRCVKAQP